MRIARKIVSASMSAMIAATQVSSVAWGQATPACFVFIGNSFNATNSSLTSADASTSQVLEVMAERRSEASAPCPPGLLRVNGQCVAQQIASFTPALPPSPSTATMPVVAATPAPAASVSIAVSKVTPKAASVAKAVMPPAATAKAASVTRASKAAPTKAAMAVTVKEPAVRSSNSLNYPDQAEVGQPSLHANRKSGAWSEVFVDRERRPLSTQNTAGVLVGYDRQFTWDGADVRLGGLGSYSSIRSNGLPTTQNTSLDVTFPNGNESKDQSGDVTPDSMLSFANSSTTSSKTRASGVGGGVTWSISRSNSFMDGVAKVDFFELNNTSLSSSTLGALNPLEVVSIFNDLGNTPNFGGIYYQDGTSKAFTATDAKGCITINSTPTDDNDAKSQVADKISKIFLASNSPAQSASASLAVMTLANNFGFTRDLGKGFTLEPSVGFRYSYSHYYNDDASLKLQDGQVLRLEAGGKLSHLQSVGHGKIWSNAAGLYVYSDVYVDGFVITTNGTSFKGDQGEVRLRGMLQSKIQFADGFQLYGEVNGRVGHDYRAIGGKLGGRIEW
jgi:hypothetical protein